MIGIVVVFVLLGIADFYIIRGIIRKDRARRTYVHWTTNQTQCELCGKDHTA